MPIGSMGTCTECGSRDVTTCGCVHCNLKNAIKRTPEPGSLWPPLRQEYRFIELTEVSMYFWGSPEKGRVIGPITINIDKIVGIAPIKEHGQTEIRTEKGLLCVQEPYEEVKTLLSEAGV